MGGCATKPKEVDSDSAPVEVPVPENPVQEVKDNEVESKKAENASESSPAVDENPVVEKDVIVEKQEEEESKAEEEPKAEEADGKGGVVVVKEEEKKDEIQSV